MRTSLSNRLLSQAQNWLKAFANMRLFRANNEIDEHALLYLANIAPVYLPACKHIKSKA